MSVNTKDEKKKKKKNNKKTKAWNVIIVYAIYK